jgi:hypothetical protein
VPIPIDPPNLAVTVPDNESIPALAKVQDDGLSGER